MGKVLDFSSQRFRKVNAIKITEACNAIDKIVLDMLYDDRIPPNEVFPAIAHRLGYYISLTDADREKIVKRLAQVMYKRAKLEYGV